MLQSKSPVVKARFETHLSVILRVWAVLPTHHKRLSTSVETESLNQPFNGIKHERVQSLPMAEQDRLYRNTTGLTDRHGRAYDRRYQVKDRDWNTAVLTEEQQEMIRKLVKCKKSLDWERALEIYQALPENAGDEWQPVFRSVLHCLCKALRYHEAKQVFQRLPVKDTPAYNFMLLMLARLQHLEEFDRVLGDMDAEAVPRNAITYCHIMTSCATSHNWSEALSSLGSLKADSTLHDGSNWAVAYLLPMSACARAKQRLKVEELLKEYRSSGKGTPQRNHYNCLIVACGSDWEAALKVFQDLRAEGWRPARPDWHALMRCHMDFQEQRKVFAQMRHDLPDALPEEAWGILLRTAILNDDLDVADWVLEDMRENGCDPDSPRAQAVPFLKRAISSWRARQKDAQLQTAWESYSPSSPSAFESFQNGEGSTKSESRLPISAASELPRGWQSTIDPNTGQPYYWRIEDPAGTTTWERPAK